MPHTTELISAEWNVVTGEFDVVAATVKGMGGVHGECREDFERALVQTLPEGTGVMVRYRQEPAAQLPVFKAA